jgi:hypothetical protein
MTPLYTSYPPLLPVLPSYCYLGCIPLLLVFSNCLRGRLPGKYKAELTADMEVGRLVGG